MPMSAWSPRGKTTSSVSLPTDCRRRSVGRPRSRWSTTIRRRARWSRSGANQAAGLGGVWARENTREAIWDALKRKEVYATTGDRPVVRLFAGWDFAPADLDRADFAANGYAHGVPMGGNLSKAPAGKRPVFLVHAMRDPDGPNLDRIQVIKGWLGKDGKSAGAHLRRGRVRRAQDRPGWPLQDPGRATPWTWRTRPTPTPSARRLLSAYWKDPAFDAAQRAFYYVRVIQIPSPRWTAYDQKRFGIKMAEQRADDGHRPRLHLAGLVHAVSSTRETRHE